jgi:DNA helicase HerA-like ATPase
MTGSGKTVLTKAVIEEALTTGIPVVVIDLKGDLASLGIVPLALKPEELATFCKEEDDAVGKFPGRFS